MEEVTGYVYRNVYHAMFEDIMKVYNRYPISEVIIHPRLQKDYYNNHPNWEIFAESLEQSVHPVCYNGDIFTKEDYERFLMVERIMLGRGVVTNSGLLREIQTGRISGGGEKSFLNIKEQ